MSTRKLGAYRLLERIGQGGMGEVWRAEHESLDSPAAVKLIRPEALGAQNEAERSRLLKRFEREARITASLSSPHTIRLFDFGTAEDGTLYYAMELLDGLDTNSLVSRFGALPPPRAVSLLLQVCDSLAEAHHQGMIHRDIKPANIFACRMGLQYDFVKVLDFGLVKSLARGKDASQLTADNITAGTPAFMAPELALSKLEIGVRTDIYAFGCLAYWLLTGQLVFEGETALETLLGHLNAPAQAPSERLGRPLPPGMDTLILSCLAKTPEQRPASIAAVRSQLAAIPLGGAWTEEDATRWWTAQLPELAKRPQEPTTPSPSQELAATAEGVAVVDPQLSAARERVVLQLRNQFAYSAIGMDEFERRVEAAENAKNQKQLDAVMEGLRPMDTFGHAIALPAPAQPPAARPSTGHALAPTSSANTGQTGIAVFSGFIRRGYWEVPPRLDLFTVMGGAELDFSCAKMDREEVHISVFAFMGGAKLIVPKDMHVTSDIVGILGGVDLPTFDQPPQPGQKRIHLTGFALFGGVGVEIAGAAEEKKKKALPE
ncbi:MAG: protein kinase [Myxococcota bacterium]|jgi:serine/threonine protein kinase|nr:protein kinase [Myxococcota bacterium]